MKKKTIGILEFFARHNEEFSEKVGYSRTKGTYVRYQVVYHHVKDYIRKRYAKKDLEINQIGASFVEGFDTWLRSGRGLSPNSVWGYIIVFKHILALARNEGLTDINPFASYVNAYTPVDRGYLSEDELRRFMAVPMLTPMEELVRDLFLFSVFTGLAYIDIRNLHVDNLKQAHDGTLWVIKRRQKTRVESNVLLLDVPLRIIEKYCGRGLKGRLFPVPSNNCCNMHLRQLAERCGLRQHLSFHIGRHTFAMLALNRGMPIETLSRILGHTSIRTTQIYAKISNQKISADMAALAKQLSAVEHDICRWM